MSSLTSSSPTVAPRAGESNVALVVTSFPASGDVSAFVAVLLERRLIACGTTLPGARSQYRWEGELTEQSETVVLLKTDRARVAALKAALPALHPYDVPEFLVIGVHDALEAYAAWVGDESR